VEEPVAWRSPNASPPGGFVIFQQYPQALADLGGVIEPLYTAPPQRLPLTEEDVAQNLRSRYDAAKLLEERRQEISAQREKLAHWMRSMGYATGHGDTIEDLLDHLGTQIAEGLEVEAVIRARSKT
jgi:hypothetical protein